MSIETILGQDSVLCNAQARSKKHSLEILSELLARPNADIAVDDIFENLIERERLGCTSLDLGVAFPHCRIDGLKEPVAAMIRLSEPVDFDAVDGEPVDLIFGLIVPDDIEVEHYKIIRDIADFLKGHYWREAARAAKSSSELCRVLLDASRTPIPAVAGGTN